jgi:hypothetical protein
MESAVRKRTSKRTTPERIKKADLAREDSLIRPLLFWIFGCPTSGRFCPEVGISPRCYRRKEAAVATDLAIAFAECTGTGKYSVRPQSASCIFET